MQWPIGIEWSRDQRHVPKRSRSRLLMFRAQYLENSWSCYLATIANYKILCCKAVLYGRLSSDSLAFCCTYVQWM